MGVIYYKNGVDIPDSIEGIRVGSAHFKGNCFQNLIQKSMGFVKKLVLKADAVVLYISRLQQQAGVNMKIFICFTE